MTSSTNVYTTKSSSHFPLLTAQSLLLPFRFRLCFRLNLSESKLLTNTLAGHRKAGTQSAQKILVAGIEVAAAAVAAAGSEVPYNLLLDTSEAEVPQRRLVGEEGRTGIVVAAAATVVAAVVVAGAAGAAGAGAETTFPPYI